MKLSQRFSHVRLCIKRQCCPTQHAHPKWLRMKPLHRGFQWCIDFEHCMSIIVVADKHHFGGKFLGLLQNIVIIPIIEIHGHRPRSPWCTTQETHPKWLIKTGFHPSWSSLWLLGICSGTNLRQRRLVLIFYGILELAGTQPQETEKLVIFWLQKNSYCHTSR